MLEPARSDRMRDALRFTAGVAAAAIAAVCLTSFELGRRSLVFNEAASAAYAHLSVPELLRALRYSDAYFGLYYAIMHAWLGFGESEAALRSFSVVCATAAVVAIALLARAAGGARAGVIAGALAASSPVLFDLGHAARPYALVLVAASLASWAFLAAAARPTPARWGVYAALAVAGCYVHLFAIALVLAHCVWATLFRPALYRRGMPFAVLAVCAALAPLLIVMHGYGSVNAYLLRPSPHELVDTAYWFAGSRLVFALALLAAAAWFVLRRGDLIRNRETLAFLALWYVVPPALFFGLSYAAKPMFAARYLVEVWPAFVIGAAFALARFPAPAAAALTAVFVALSLRVTFSDHVATIQDWRAATALVLGRATERDAVVIFPKRGSVPYNYYRSRLGGAGPHRIYPDGDWWPLVQGRDTVEAASVSTGPVQPDRIWVVEGWTDIAGTNARLARFLTALSPAYRLARNARFTRVAVLRYDRRPLPQRASAAATKNRPRGASREAGD